jgi:hypothetical protein
MIGKFLQTSSTKVTCESCNWPRKNLGIVKMMQQTSKVKGQSAGLWPKSEKKTGYGQPSETERMWVFNDSLINLRRLKIQSALERDFKDTATPIRLFNTLYKSLLWKFNIFFVIR